MSLKMRMKSILVFDAACAAFFTLLALLFSSEGYHILSVGTFFLVLFFLHALIVPFKGLNFVLWDAPPDNAVKYYAFFAIFLSSFFGGWIKILVVPYLNQRKRIVHARLEVDMKYVLPFFKIGFS